MARYYHVTTTHNLLGIMATGIDPAYSRGRMKVSWYVRRARVAWAVLHVVQRHAVALSDIIILGVDVHDYMIRRHGRGLHYCREVVPPECIRSAVTWVDAARSPVDDPPGDSGESPV